VETVVNAMTVGLANSSRIFYSAAAGLGNSVVYVGSKTGRDGIKGAKPAVLMYVENAEPVDRRTEDGGEGGSTPSGCRGVEHLSAPAP